MEEIAKPTGGELLKVNVHGGIDWEVGDQIMSDRCEVLTITRIWDDGKRPLIKGGPTANLLVTAEGGTYSNGAPRVTTYRLGEWLGYRYVKVYGSLEELRAQALAALADPDSLDALDVFGGDGTQETALAPTAGPEAMQTVRNLAAVLREKTEVMQRMATAMMRPLQEMQRRMAARVSHIENMLDVLAAFTGIYEQITQIRDGARAPEDTPLTLRQFILYMDEEAAITDYIKGREGISWASVDAFDRWLLADPAHVQQVLPEPKGLVALKPSRQNRDRGDWWLDQEERANNQRTYLLIRNGDALFRVWTGFSLGELLYPKEGEFADIMRHVAEEKANADDQYKWQGVELGWKRNIALLQGLIERTDVFQPLPPGVNLFDPDAQGPVVLVRDGENLLTDGRPRFWEWQAQLNRTLKRGDRIYFVKKYEDSDSRRYRFTHHYNYPPEYPTSGVYTLDRVEQRNANDVRLIFLYMPSDEVWVDGYGYKERERREGFKVYPSDSCILPYDHLDAATLRYYMTDRLSRNRYLDMLPVLRGLLKELEAEGERERAFAQLVAEDMGVAVDTVYQYIEWWKFKVIHKRPLAADDAKAWRMIRQAIQGKWLDRTEQNTEPAAQTG